MNQCPARAERSPLHRWAPPLFLAMALCIGPAGCSGNAGDEDLGTTSPDCDPLMPVACGLPWPSNLYLAPDPARKTGYTLTFGETSLPANRAGVHVKPGPYRRLDGYSVGTPLLVLFPNLDISRMAGEDHIERSLAKDAQVLWFEVSGATVRRVPYWVELDSFETDPAQQTLFVRPAEILKEGTRYVVAFRDLSDTSGTPIAPSPAFSHLRDGSTGSIPALSPRQARFDQVFSVLEAQGVPRASLTLAWDFVTASGDALHGDLLHMRDDALARVGPRGPQLTVTKVTEFISADDGSGRPVDADIALELEGTFEVPSYLDPLQLGSFTGSQLHRDATEKPAPSGTRAPHFWVRVPRSAPGGMPHGMVLYGHGLLGSGDQVRGGFNGRIANGNRLIYFAADLTGMATDDNVLVFQSLQDMTRFVSLTDRLHQGITEWVLLARAMREQLGGLKELTQRGVMINKGELFYSGISQGGIFGGTFVAVSPDVTYGHLGVPGNNYSTLLHRSTDFDQFLLVIGSVYPATVSQAILLSVMQLTWDATDPVSHLRHITAEPYPGNQPHYVLLGPARGDHQVAPVTDEVLARSDVGVAIMEHYDEQRMVYGTTEKPYPYRGSGIVLWNFGNPWPAPGNHPPHDMLDDPHEKPRRNDAHNQQLVHFFRTGEIIDVCQGKPCHPQP